MGNESVLCTEKVVQSTKMFTVVALLQGNR